MSDIKLFRPERLTDNPDGGGLATHTEIVDGEVNNLFDDISRIDRVNGDLSLRAVFAVADTLDTELFSGLHMIIAAPPLDPRVDSVLFRTRRGQQYAWGDERADAQAAVERYLDESVITRMVPYDRQLEGQRTVLVYQRPELTLPEIGEVYVLRNETANITEFIRVEDIEHQVETFTDINGDYRARVITLTISQPLSQEFTGSQPNRFFTVDATRTVLRRTVASDAARYKGTVRLAQDASPGDLTIKVESIFSQLVPAATSEVGVTDAGPGGTEIIVAAGNATVATPPVVMEPAPTQLVFETAAQIGVRVQESTGTVWEEQRDGSFLRVAGTNPGVLNMSPDRTRVLMSGLNSGIRTISATYRPAAVLGRPAFFWQAPVEIQNRGYVYSGVLRPIPAPGATSLSFRALGQWYTLQDDGTGALRGDAGVGTGLVNFQTGSFTASLGALPDIGSSVIVSSAGTSEYEILVGDLDIEVPSVRLTLDAANAEPGTLSLSWLAGGTVRTATDNGSGQLTGDGAGRVLYSTGEVELVPGLLPDANATLTATYQAGATSQELFAPVRSGANIILTVAVPPRPGSIRIEYMGYAKDEQDASYEARRVLRDNGSGALLDDRGATVAGSSVNYGTGQIAFPADFMASARQAVRSSFDQIIPAQPATRATTRASSWVTGMKNSQMPAQFEDGSAVNVTYKSAAASDTPRTEEYDLPPLRVDLTPRVRNAIVPRSLKFRLGGRSYYERGGSLYYGMSPTTGAGTPAGTLDFQTGIATITSWAGGIAPQFAIDSLLSEVSPLPIAVVHGRTPGSPLRPSTFYIQANLWRGGALVSATADNNGVLQAPGIRGWVDSTNGVYSVAFGEDVPDASLSPADKAEGWYNPANVSPEGLIWRPQEVMPGTISFNCVIQVAATLDPEIIGVNPVRLPMDGRVAVIRRGDTLVVHDPLPHVLPAGLVAGQVTALPRAAVDTVAVYDQRGLGVPPTLYQLDKAAGELTWATPLDLSPYQQPLVAIHSIDEMALCLDAQITGEVSLGQPLTRHYSAGNSLCSSAQVIGDVQARYQGLFAQNTWTGVWSDTLIGSPPTGGAQYNDAAFPLVVVNRHTITQRWRLQFTSATAFNVIGEELGVIGTGTTSAGASPLNPATGEPYFRILPGGFGAGWATGNNIRFNTVAAGGKIWVARTTRSGPATNTDDRIRLQARWDKD
ncbi:hypothetical protein PQS31_06270 [Luteimonas sp BLCC-B24]|uniref:hypothetical protein n=1 Tax=Luteimonas sp. BLCC-B24 TaxID=3025317 RepID=UPI00234DB49C|nr:hypothetical protein [Luteimonas sp. BLCC-B24]MDC7806429.1 hypothetical protein [Luteimonas sp. BLCC-B24]